MSYVRGRELRTLCVSTYRTDLEAMDRKVDRFKLVGYPRASRSQLIRMAVAMLDVDKIEIRAATVEHVEASMPATPEPRRRPRAVITCGCGEEFTSASERGPRPTKCPTCRSTRRSR